MTISSQEKPLVAWSLLLSQTEDFLNIQLARVSKNPNQEGTMETRDEVLSVVGEKDMATSVYQVSDLDDIDFYWENGQLYVSAIFRPGIDIPFPLLFNDLVCPQGLKTLF